MATVLPLSHAFKMYIESPYPLSSMLPNRVLIVDYPALVMLTLGGGHPSPDVLHVLPTPQTLIFRIADIQLAEVLDYSGVSVFTPRFG